MVMSDENGGCIFVSVGDGSYSCGQLGREADDDDMTPRYKDKDMPRNETHKHRIIENNNG